MTDSTTLTTSQRAGILVEMTPAQRLYRDLLDPEPGEHAGAWNHGRIWHCRGHLTPATLQLALTDLVERHEALRSNLSADADALVIHRTLAVPLERQRLPAGEAEAGLAALCQREVRRPFDLHQAPLHRWTLIEVAPGRAALLVVAHPLICDGWSFGVLFEDLLELYRHRAAGEAGSTRLAPAPTLRAAVEQIPREEAQEATRQAHWTSSLAEGYPTVPLIPDRATTTVDYRCAHVRQRLEATTVAALIARTGHAGVSLVSALCGVWGLLGARLAGASEAQVLLAAAGQALHPELDRAVAQLSHDLPVTFPADLRSTLDAALVQAQRAILDGYENAPPTPPLSQPRGPFQLMRFNFDPDISASIPVLPGLECWFETLPREADFADAFVNAERRGAEIELCCQYNASRFSAKTATRWLQLYVAWLGTLAEGRSVAIGDLPLLDPAEREQALVAWNRTERERSDPQTLHGLFAKRVAASPEARAVEFGDEWLSYAELDARSALLAALLRQRGVERGQLVAVCLRRSLELPVALLGVLRAGAAYVPLDPDYPADRLEFMLADSDARLVLAQRQTRDRLPAGTREVMVLEELSLQPTQTTAAPQAFGDPDDLAYVLFTSGSTGRPKGVQITHRGICNHAQWVAETFALAPGDRCLQYTSISFDASIVEVFVPLATGGTVVVALPDQHRDPAYLARALREQAISFVQFVPSMLRAVLSQPDFERCSSLRQVICGGEALSWELVDDFRRRSGAQLTNCYGPTETSIDAAAYRLPAGGAAAAETRYPTTYVPIGLPIANTTCYVLDEQLSPVPVGVPGELFVGGIGLARGYLKRPDLTAERFVANPFVPGHKIYRTGDRVARLADGNIAFLGRVDTQVKVRGFRIELGEIESALAACPGVEASVAVAREDRPGLRRIVAYVVGPSVQVSTVRETLKQRLAGYMLPSVIMKLDELPLLPNGKLNRAALPKPGGARPDLIVPYQAPLSDLEAEVCGGFADVLDLDEVGRLDNFFDLGGNSLLALEVLERILRRTGRGVSAPTLFAHPTPAGLASHIDGSSEAAAELAAAVAPVRRAVADDPICIIGMTGRFPGADSVEELWANLLAARDSITHFTTDELDGSVPAVLRADASYVRSRGVLRDVQAFDAAFFAIPAREAEIIDPQQRILLELAWECLELAGYAPDRITFPVGVFTGVDTNTYVRALLGRPDIMERQGDLQITLGNDKDYAATRIAYKLNLRGPAVAVNTACSTSLVAIVQAVESLRAGRCRMALAGGCSVNAPPNVGYQYQDGGMLSPDGHTRSFDADARGTVFNDGAAVVLLKRLSEAIADGDRVFAVIRGVGINNDGGGKASFTAPSVDGQATAIAAAHADAGIEAATITYIEAHGTATPLGDPVEVEALTRAFRLSTQRTSFCRIGSVKSNVGHLVAAAGATGLIKTALALWHETIPPTIHYRAPNPRIDFAKTPFVVADSLCPWPRAADPRRAGVSSFGIGGTNAHVVLEESPPLTPSAPATGWQLLFLSARDRESLGRMTERLARHLESEPALNLADVAYTLRHGRSRFKERLAVVASSVAEACTALRDATSTLRVGRTLPSRAPAVVFVFPGQGAQYVGMGSGLYASEPAFREAFDECCAVVAGVVDFELKQRVFGGAPDQLSETATTQPATFALEYALARLWQSRGLQPSALIGHSVGEFVAAVLSGVMSLSDAARLVARRGALLQALPSGAMLSVRLRASELETRLPADVSLAAENGPNLCVVAGPHKAIEALQGQLEAGGIVAKLLHTSHAFHSAMMEPAVGPFEALVRQAKLEAPSVPIISTLTGTWMTPNEATDVSYWARHLRAPVRFSPSVRTALAKPGSAFVEVGPRGTLSTLIRQHGAPGSEAPVAVASLADRPEDEARSFALANASLWALGIEVRQPADAERRQRLPLPAYPFARTRYWVAPASPATTVAPVATLAPTYPAASAPVPSFPLPVSEIPVMSAAAPSSATPTREPREPQLLARLATLIEDVTGVEMAAADPNVPFVELGLDSLALTQVATQFKKTFSISVTFRQLMEQHRSLALLAKHLDQQLPPEPQAAAPAAPAPPAGAFGMAPLATVIAPPAGAVAGNASADLVRQVIQQQMQLMAQQLAVLGGVPLAAGSAQAPVAVSASTASAAGGGAPATLPTVTASAPEVVDAPARVTYDVKKAFGAIARIHVSGVDLSDRHQARLADLIRRYVARTPKSKEFTARNRSHLADPRVVNGFRPQTKEIVYQIVVDRSAGARMWDIDGNEYIDVLNGFGMCLFGWQPDFVQAAVREQLELGYDIGPLNPIAADVTRLVCELTGSDRAGLVNTGSEAVMAAIRIARTVTARSTIVSFAGSYHGTFDEVLVRPGRKNRGIPAAPGIMPGMFGDIVVLDYGTPQALEAIRELGDDVAAVLVEPIQSRRPEFQPHEFVRELRALTAQNGTCLIFDDVIMGFRSHPRGSQGIYGVQADLGTYGKVIGGGMPIGVVAGKRDFMDALDGGSWQYGDDSMPTVGVTYFAGTFVRHPLALAAARASLIHLKEHSPRLQDDLNARTTAMVAAMNRHCRKVGVPIEVRHFSSLWRIVFTEDHPFQDLFFAMMRTRGIHMLDNFPCFLTTAHGDAEIATILRAFRESVAEMADAGFLPARPDAAMADALDSQDPPVPGARLGRDSDGNPAWFVPNPDKPGKFLKLEA